MFTIFSTPSVNIYIIRRLSQKINIPIQRGKAFWVIYSRIQRRNVASLLGNLPTDSDLSSVFHPNILFKFVFLLVIKTISFPGYTYISDDPMVIHGQHSLRFSSTSDIKTEILTYITYKITG